jgi:hypothetical protein
MMGTSRTSATVTDDLELASRMGLGMAGSEAGLLADLAAWLLL